jgi:four helix bundle protein
LAFQDDGFFDFERLDAYRLAREHFECVLGLNAASCAKDHLDRAAESVMLNLAEGSGKPKGSADRRKFYCIALGSAKECACAWTLLCMRGRVDEQLARRARAILLRVVAMLSRMVT